MENMQALNGSTDPAVTLGPGTRTQVHRQQSIRSVERIAEVETLLNNLTANAEMAAHLQARGYDATRLAEGAALRATVLEAFVTRQQAIGALREAHIASNAALEIARAEYVEFRASARALFKSPADRARLDLDAPIPNDANAFTGLARIVYHTAQETPALADALAGYGYPSERLDELLTHANAAADAMHAVDAARSNAQQATMQREVAIRALESWMARLMTAARLATRNRRDLRALLA